MRRTAAVTSDGVGRSLSRFRKRAVPIATALVVLCAATILVGGTANADPAGCYIADQIFPTATAPPPFYWALANGDSSYITRGHNGFPCSGNRENAWTTHLLLNGTTGDYIETGYIETGTTTVDDYHPFWEAIINGVLVGGAAHEVDSLCGGPFHADNGASGFRVRRFWATTWVAEIDCHFTGTWATAKSLDVSYNPSYGIIRSEEERFSVENGFAVTHDALQWRDITTGAWTNWNGYGCYSTPLNWHYLDLHRISGNSWNLVNGTGTC